MFQVRVVFEKDVHKQEAMWERQHELAAEKIYSMCSDMGGFFLKVYINAFGILAFCFVYLTRVFVILVISFIYVFISLVYLLSCRM